MTSERSMLKWTLAALVAALVLGGCSSGDKLTPPEQLTAPYDASSGPPLWAVAPLRNESGTTAGDPLVMTDKVIAAVAQTQGLRVLPQNRTLEAMAALRMSSLASPADIIKLAQHLGVDGVIVGSLTAYDPYTPTVGLSLALYARPGSLTQKSPEIVDSRVLSHQSTDYNYFGNSNFRERPASVASRHLDGKDHGVQMRVQAYARGRSDPTSALGWRRYLASMELFTEFAAWETTRGLLDEEWIRLANEP